MWEKQSDSPGGGSIETGRIASAAQSVLQAFLHPLRSSLAAIAAWGGVAFAASVICLLAWYSYWVGRRKDGSLQTSSEVFAAPRLIRIGDRLTAADLIRYLQRS